MSSEMKECPVCGKTDRLILATRRRGIDWFWVECIRCHISGLEGSSDEAALEVWNSIPRKEPKREDCFIQSLDKLKLSAQNGELIIISVDTDIDFHQQETMSVTYRRRDLSDND